MLKGSRTRERRWRERFPIVLPAEVQIKGDHLIGETANISSCGLLITYGVPYKPKVGRRAKVRIHWPCSSSDTERLLIIEGSVVRSGTGFVAIRRVHYEFVEIGTALDDGSDGETAPLEATSKPDQPGCDPAVPDFSESSTSGKD